MLTRYQRTYLILLLFVISACREEYLPPAITARNNFLVVEGIINTGTDSTIFKLSRTKNLSDTIFEIPELYAVVLIQAKGGGFYALSPLGNGLYGVASLPLNPNETYRVKVSTISGGLYESDYVSIKQTPPIDSVSWKQDHDVIVYVNTHDPLNNTRYYRWDFVETWEYHSYYESYLGYDYRNNFLYYLDSSQTVTNCWTTAVSTDVFLGTTENLSQDIVTEFPLTKIPNGSDKIIYRYSMLVRQYALDKEAFQYWQLLRKNAKEMGSIFGTQPAELIGNIRCISNANEPVIGFISASSVTEKRIFIRNFQLLNWDSQSQDILCAPQPINPDSTSYYLTKDTSIGPAYFMTGGGLALAKKACTDCRYKGGKTDKPAYW